MSNNFNQSKNMKKDILFAFIAVAVAVVVGLMLMILVYLLPVSGMRQNILKSSEMFEMEGDSYCWAPGVESTHLDNYTDAMMYNEAVFIGTGSLLKDAMNNSYISYEGDNSQCLALVRAAFEEELSPEAVVIDYARYWHGYLVWMKPLLLVCTPSHIRMISVGFQFLLLIFALALLYKKGGFGLLIPFAAGVLTLGPVNTALCMQFASVYIIMLIGTIVIMLPDMNKNDIYWKVFLGIGIATAYFDFLTYPLVGLAFPMLVMLSMLKTDIRDKFYRMIKSAFYWFFGYVGMWSGKWIVSFILTGNNTLREGVNAVRYRAYGDAMGEANIDSSSAIKVIIKNVGQLLNPPMIMLLLVIVLAIVLFVIIKKDSIEFGLSKDVVCTTALIGISPFLWYMAIKNHSAIHAYMTHRNLAVTVFAMLFLLMAGFKIKGKNENNLP